MILSIDNAQRSEITQSIASAAAQTGADFDYLMSTAMRESSLNPSAKARTSSATGLYQFIEQTWLATVDKHGPAHGLDAYAEAITKDAKGRYVVADKALKQEILALRKDAGTSALMAGELAEDNRASLENALGRKVTDGELYAAHFLGVAGAEDLLRAVSRDPSCDACTLFPAAAKSNRSIFYGTGGEALSVGEVYAKVTKLPQVEADQPASVTQVATSEVFDELRGRAMSPEEGAQSVVVAGTGPVTPMSEQPLILTPQVMEILASVQAPPENFRQDDSGERPQRNIGAV
ncbi:MAG: transglycosylase SLT domain-containing protein [Alphaproteobacteria bacterium]|nr:transglycosylase SLT domain-containing protein [Alphaproteobacteria bacterium]